MAAIKDEDIETLLDPDVELRDAPHVDLQRKLGAPSVVLDDVHITYRVFGGRAAHRMTVRNKSRLQKMINRGKGGIGAITEVPAVRGVSFAARHGESIGIVGINGSGKSTLLRAIAGVHPPTKGTVYVSGEPALLGVNAILLADLTGRQNIMIGGLALGLTKQEVRARSKEIVDFAGIGDFVDLPMSAYSSGMGARLRFAISSLAQPDILMIDEALGAGDSTFKEKSRQRFEDILEHAGTIFLVSHSVQTVKAMCTRGLWLDRGKLVMDGPVDEVCDAYEGYAKAIRGRRQAGASLRDKP